MDDLISRKKVLALPRNKVQSLRTHEVVEETINVTDIEHLPSAQSEDVVGIINNSVDNALTLLDSIYSSGRMMYYSDYCALHDAISSISAQTVNDDRTTDECNEIIREMFDHWDDLPDGMEAEL